MEKLKYITMAVGAFAIGGVLAGGAAQAAMPGVDAIRSAAAIGAVVEQVQFRFGGRDFCWYDDGWQGPGWYWCGYGHRIGFGWGGPIGWNNWSRFHRDHDDFRRDRDDFRRDHDDRHDHDDRRDHDDRFRH